MTGIDINAEAKEDGDLKDDDLPVLTDTVDTPIVSPGKTAPSADELVKLESKLCAKSLTLADQLLHDACHDVEHIIVERVMSKLRSELPALISRALHDHFDDQD